MTKCGYTIMWRMLGEASKDKLEAHKKSPTLGWATTTNYRQSGH